MAKKWNCPTCGQPNVPEGMHCRDCLCDILSEEPIGTMARFVKDQRNSRRESRAKPVRMVIEFGFCPI